MLCRLPFLSVKRANVLVQSTDLFARVLDGLFYRFVVTTGMTIYYSPEKSNDLRPYVMDSLFMRLRKVLALTPRISAAPPGP